MDKKMVLGIDIGGTNTDGVLVNQDGSLIASLKVGTTRDLVGGVVLLIEGLLKQSKVTSSCIKAVFISSTHATNALLEARKLNRVGVIRIAENNPQDLPPCLNWPIELQQALNVQVKTINGGYELDGRPMAPLNEENFVQAARFLLEKGAESLALVGVFSPLYATQEQTAAALVERYFPGIPYTCSSDVGTIGFLERENAAVLNAALKNAMAEGFALLRELFTLRLPKTTLFVVQNNGSTITMEKAIEFPLLMLATGPTNSFIGAAALSGLSECVVVDIGGTSTDIGAVRQGVARRTLGASSIAGVSLNFSMPDVVALACGGGSLVTVEGRTVRREKRSVGADLFSRSFSFGGDTFTLTDMSLKSGLVPASLFNRPVKKIATISQEQAELVMRDAAQEIAGAVERFAPQQKSAPVVFVGGGARLFPQAFLQHFFPKRAVVCPECADVANAYGASRALVSGVVDEVVLFEDREQALSECIRLAERRACEAGADQRTIKVVEQLVMPCNYLARPMARVRIGVVGVLRQ